MPFGGQSNAGSGLRLQNADPGAVDKGNGNISGAMRAGKFSCSPTGAISAQLFGEALNVVSPAQSLCMFGQNLGAESISDGVMFGYSCSMKNRQQVCIGIGNTVGHLYGLQGHVVIGRNCSAGLNITDAADHIAMGILTAVGGSRSVAFGRSVNLAGRYGSDDNELVGIGIDLSASAVQTGLSPTFGLMVGKGIRADDRMNFIAIGMYSAGARLNAVDNGIVIGNDAQTYVKIGPYSIGPGLMGVVQESADADLVAAATTAVVAFTALTQNRTVTLPLAAAYPKGARLLVADWSGSAAAGKAITIQRQGADTINAGTTAAISTAFGSVELQSNGSGKWIITGGK